MKVPRTKLAGVSRRGSAYLLVLGGSMLLVVAGMGALYASGVRRAAGELEVDAWKSRLAAEAGVEAALDDIYSDTSWRTSKSNGAWYTDRTMGDGSFTVSVTDPIDGDLRNNPGDNVDVLSVGASGRGRSKLKVSLHATPVPLSVLGAVLCSGGNQVHTATTINNDQIIHSGGNIATVAGSVAGSVEAENAVLGFTYSGSTQANAAARQAPALNDLAYYRNAGTVINRNNLNGNSSRWYLENCVLSAASNPLGGGTNPMGIYVINLSNDDLTIRNCRIVGTLVLVNAGNSSDIRGSVNITPAVSNYPVLIIDGNFQLGFDSTSQLSEAGLGRNFNPVGTPYQGVADADMADAYPSEIRGLVYIKGSLTTSVSPKVVGNLICTGSLSTSGTLTLSYSATCFSSPPPGFEVTPVPMSVVPGSWVQLVD